MAYMHALLSRKYSGPYTKQFSLIPSICSWISVMSVECTFFPQSIGHRYLLASLSVSFFLSFVMYLLALFFYLHSLLLSQPTFTLTPATVFIYIWDSPLVSYWCKCLCMCVSLTMAFYWFVCVLHKVLKRLLIVFGSFCHFWFDSKCLLTCLLRQWRDIKHV